ncbi:hypothetical protein DL89DRAFT_269748, partial [Linderina pennispora]
MDGCRLIGAKTAEASRSDVIEPRLGRGSWLCNALAIMRSATLIPRTASRTWRLGSILRLFSATAIFTISVPSSARC